MSSEAHPARPPSWICRWPTLHTAQSEAAASAAPRHSRSRSRYPSGRDALWRGVSSTSSICIWNNQHQCLANIPWKITALNMGPSNGLVPWANVDRHLCPHIAQLGHNELKPSITSIRNSALSFLWQYILTHWPWGGVAVIQRVYIMFKVIIQNIGFSTGSEIALRQIPQHLTNENSTLVPVIAWCHQAPSHYLSQCWPEVLIKINKIKEKNNSNTFFSEADETKVCSWEAGPSQQQGGPPPPPRLPCMRWCWAGQPADQHWQRLQQGCWLELVCLQPDWTSSCQGWTVVDAADQLLSFVSWGLPSCSSCSPSFWLWALKAKGQMLLVFYDLIPAGVIIKCLAHITAALCKIWWRNIILEYFALDEMIRLNFDFEKCTGLQPMTIFLEI